ncbi:OmpA family protein [Thiocapsa sp.]|uniref:OmpA family protein n=1 Tax=Thiocapsa sp. TaxID=2024551 RepID=UPI002D1C048F|nr:OmpA family protein [Thiocapsa sp.]HSO81736.1 OmpA family protein [Thiocapsa sp.]
MTSIARSSVLFKDIFGRALVYVDVIETSAMETRLIDAEGLAKALGEQGRIAVPNIYFDFGQAILKPESQPALDEIVRLLSAQRALNLYVVGHTDNVGGYESNLSLSRARAEAVVAALVSQADMDRARLVPAGVADLAPVASTTTESGRAMNRRVELVARELVSGRVRFYGHGCTWRGLTRDIGDTAERMSRAPRDFVGWSNARGTGIARAFDLAR